MKLNTMNMQNVIKALLLSGFLGLTSSCGHLQLGSDKGEESQIKSSSLSKGEGFHLTKKAEQDYQPDAKYGKMPLVVNAQVDKWIRYFQGRGRPHMTRYLQRSTRYLPLMKRILRERGLPQDLSYVALIESGFRPHARSIASAVGYWQFILGTGRIYDLRIDKYVDERRDPVLSTEAAASYFQSLYNLFGDWYLALASYNSGENRIKRNVMRHKTRDFWVLAKKRRRGLPRETRNYVPKFIAATLIAKSPQVYGFIDIEFHKPFEYDTVFLTRPISFKKLAKEMNIELKALKQMNPKFRYDYSPIYGATPTEIRVPVGMRSLAVASLDASVGAIPKITKPYMITYRIRKGDTLSGIAHKYRTRVSVLRRVNHLRRRSLLKIGKRILIPEGRSKRRSYASQRKKSQVRRKVAKRNLKKGNVHVVRRGENLTLIAKKYGVSVRTLRRMNRMGRRSLIRIGQHIQVAGITSI